MAVDAFIQSTSALTESLVSISAGGLALIVLIWAAMFGLKDDLNLKGFRFAQALLAPFGLFLGAYVAVQFFVFSAIAGYRWEVMQCRWRDPVSDKFIEITDPDAHFLDQYAELLQNLTGGALLATVGAVVLLSGWFVVNVFLATKMNSGA